MSDDEYFPPGVSPGKRKVGRPKKQPPRKKRVEVELSSEEEVEESKFSEFEHLASQERTSLQSILRDAEAYRGEFRQLEIRNASLDKDLKRRSREYIELNKKVSTYELELSTKAKQIADLKQKLASASASASSASSASSSSSSSSSNPQSILESLSSLALDAYRTRSDALQEGYDAKVESVKRAALRSKAPPKTVSVVTFETDASTWEPMDESFYDDLMPLVTGALPASQTVTYTFNGHTYEARALSPGKYVQKNTSHANQKERAIRCETIQQAPPVIPMPDDWRIELLSGEPPLSLSQKDARSLILSSAFVEESKTVVGSVQIAELAEYISSKVSGFSYCRKRSELWVKPAQLRLWLELAAHREYKGIRVVMHGSAEYDKLRKDPLGYDLAYNGRGRFHVGFYCAVTDSVPAYWMKEKYKGNTYKIGTMMIGLLLDSARGNDCFRTGDPEGKPIGSFHTFQSTSNNNGTGPTGWDGYSNVYGNPNFHDSFAVYDQSSFLPLGLAVAK